MDVTCYCTLLLWLYHFVPVAVERITPMYARPPIAQNSSGMLVVTRCGEPWELSSPNWMVIRSPDVAVWVVDQAPRRANDSTNQRAKWLSFRLTCHSDVLPRYTGMWGVVMPLPFLRWQCQPGFSNGQHNRLEAEIKPYCLQPYISYAAVYNTIIL